MEVVPPEEYREFSELTARARGVWEKAKAKSDFKEFLDNLLKETQESDCLSKAIKYCSKGLKTEQQVKNNLFSKGFNGQIIYKTIEKLKSSKFIDDAEYSKRYMESTANKQGARLTNYKLYGKGIKKEVIDNTFLDSTIDYKTSAKMIAQKRLRDKIITKELLAKTYRYLIGRGFSYEEASYAISDYKVED